MKPRATFTVRKEVASGNVLHLSVILFTGGCLPQCMLGYTPPAGTPPRPLWADTPPGQVHLPRAGTHPRVGTPPWQVHPLGRYTLPPSRYTPGRYSPPPRRSLQRTVRIPLECFLVLRAFTQSASKDKDLEFHWNFITTYVIVTPLGN